MAAAHHAVIGAGTHRPSHRHHAHPCPGGASDWAPSHAQRSVRCKGRSDCIRSTASQAGNLAEISQRMSEPRDEASSLRYLNRAGRGENSVRYPVNAGSIRLDARRADDAGPFRNLALDQRRNLVRSCRGWFKAKRKEPRLHVRQGVCADIKSSGSRHQP